MNYLFNLNEHLKIIQLESYDYWRYCRWQFKEKRSGHIARSSLEFSLRIKLLIVILILELLTLFWLGFGLGFIGIIFLLVWPTPLLLLPVLSSSFFVGLYVAWVKTQIRLMLNNKNLIVVGITGSYGKSSTKDFLYPLLDRWRYTLKTPGSYNTLLGIYSVIKKELLPSHQIFLCEMGAFQPGDIRELCKVIEPQRGIVTAIGVQHLERFGSLQKIAQTKFELVNYVGNQASLVNVGDEGVATMIASGHPGIQTYSADPSVKADYQLTSVTLKSNGINFTLNMKGTSQAFSTQLFGSVNLSNLVGAISQAYDIGVPIKLIVEEVEYLSPPAHRLETHVVGKTTIIDNTYSSNEKGFTQVMSDLQLVPGSKVLITPGLVELGEASKEVHERLGILAAKVFEVVYLIGKTQRTKDFVHGLNKSTYRGEVIYVEAGMNPWHVFDAILKKPDLVLMENDLPDNYY